MENFEHLSGKNPAYICYFLQKFRGIHLCFTGRFFITLSDIKSVEHALENTSVSIAALLWQNKDFYYNQNKVVGESPNTPSQSFDAWVVPHAKQVTEVSSF